MSAHHAPSKVVRRAVVLGNTIGLAGLALVVGYFLGFVAFSVGAEDFPLNGLLWGEGGVTVYSPPFGELLFGIGLLILGLVMVKSAPRVRRSEHGIPMYAAPWRAGKVIRAPIRDVIRRTAYPQRRIARRMIGLGMPAAAMAGLVLWGHDVTVTKIRDAGASTRLGATLGLIAGVVAVAASLLAVVIGIVVRAGAPSEEETKRAELAEFAASQAHPAPPPSPGVPRMPSPPPAPA